MLTNPEPPNSSTKHNLPAALLINVIVIKKDKVIFMFLCCWLFILFYFFVVQMSHKVVKLLLIFQNGFLQIRIFYTLSSLCLLLTELLCGRLHSKLYIYCSLFLQCKFLKLPFWDIVKAAGTPCQQDSISQLKVTLHA